MDVDKTKHVGWLVGKLGNNAGDAFIEAAKLFQKGNSAKFEGSRAYENASKSYKRSDPAGKRQWNSSVGYRD